MENIREWWSWFKGMIDILIKDSLIGLLIFIISIFGVFINIITLKIISWFLLIMSSFYLIFVALYLKWKKDMDTAQKNNG